MSDEATIHPSRCSTESVCRDQFRLCTTAVGASIKWPVGEYSIRTNVGVRNWNLTKSVVIVFPSSEYGFPDCEKAMRVVVQKIMQMLRTTTDEDILDTRVADMFDHELNLWIRVSCFDLLAGVI